MRMRSTLKKAGRTTYVILAVALGASPVLAAQPAPPAAEKPPTQSADSFATALRDDSTSPFYVLITVVDDATGQSRTRCTTANLLLGAIHIEHGLAFNSEGSTNARSMALANTSHVFHFSKPEALANIPMNYSPHDMEEARRLIQPLNDQQLHERFSARGDLQAWDTATKSARACALVERGLSVRMEDRSGQLDLGN